MSEPVQTIDKTGMAVGGGLAGLTAITLNEWVAIVTIVYFIIQIIIALPKLFDSVKTLWRKYGSRK